MKSKIKKQNKNQVLSEDARQSQNFYQSDLILKDYFSSFIPARVIAYLDQHMEQMGAIAAQEMNKLSQLADRYPPQLNRRDAYGKEVFEIEFHPSYQDLIAIAVKSQMFHVKWDEHLQQRFGGYQHQMGFGIGFLYAMTELGVFCPLCMTDGVARLIQQFANEEDQARLLPHFSTLEPNDFYTGAMFLTEKAGGSDVGANLVSARHFKDDLYYLNGEKWFCSNANAEVIFVLARTDQNIQGTKGLSIFLVEKKLKDGSRNPMEIYRLKDKLGVRSMASAEIELTETIGQLIGEEGQGFKIMTEMINLSRLYNAVAALSGTRRAIIEAYQFLSFRNTFGKSALSHALIRDKLEELGASYVALFLLTFHTIETLDLADQGDEEAKELLRLLTPMSKKYTAQEGVYMVRESMELMGGMGYIEDTVIPRIMRDMMVLPIWEGAGNIMTLDMLRALFKSKGLSKMMAIISEEIKKIKDDYSILEKEKNELIILAKTFADLSQESLEVSAKYFFDRLCHLYKIALVIKHQHDGNIAWMKPTLNYLIRLLKKENEGIRTPLTKEEIEHLIAWKF